METNSILTALKNNGFSTVDYGIVVVYILCLVGLGMFLSRGKKGEEKTSKDYFLAGNTLTWWAVGASLIAANISAEQFIGVSGSSFASGIAMAAYELMAAAALIVVAKILLPLMIEKKVLTVPQFLRDRYNKETGLAFSIFWLFLYVFINLTSVAWLGSLAIQTILGLPEIHATIGGMTVDVVLVSIILILFFVAGVYSIYGGLASVAWTDVMQVVFLIGGGLITAFAALSVIGADMGGVGAFGALGKIFDYFKSIPGDKHMDLIVSRNPQIADITQDSYFSIPGIAVIVGGIWLTNISYWGFNQYIIQKGLAAKNVDEARKGLLFAAFLKVLIPFIVCVPGVCAYYIMNCPDCAALKSTLSGTIDISDDAYPFLIRNFTPTIVKGLSFAALSAAIISSLASMLNSTSTIFTMDIYNQYIDKKASEKKLVTVGRLTSVCALILAIIAVYPIMGGADQAFQVVQEYSGFVYPGICVIFGLGLLWKRASGKAAIATAVGTFFFSILFKILLPNEPFLNRMGYVFGIIAAIFVVVSYLDNNIKTAENLSKTEIKWQMMVSRVLSIVSAVCFGGGVIGMFNETMRNYGIEAIFFMGAVMLLLAIIMRSNAKDNVENVDSIGINIKVFRTDKIFNLVAFSIIGVITIMYIALW